MSSIVFLSENWITLTQIKSIPISMIKMIVMILRRCCKLIAIGSLLKLKKYIVTLESKFQIMVKLNRMGWKHFVQTCWNFSSDNLSLFDGFQKSYLSLVTAKT